ncbi:flagellar biosynthesis regulator FlhF [Pontibacillus halophilus JSM 076056 = DSM 19796]|uniref:Flagellar biosynthesis protein FlhF n=1 Tax=Pontibacillus halophilus JSM 076056 = DSM 19796 TaxID=1385510 RepID=A0A0A5GPR6_9BACI|nr:flagellar biosynthesis protein FlhF [Pontibacillus halophilus]KGX93155.1 flagellar biosynthesis regulator FlhF [Pontibacillus halophilus JSM 076056 = DSM 19796]
MKVKKFEAPTMPEAMHKVRKELGVNAVILDSKELSSKGVLGLFKKKKIQVVAALDPDERMNETHSPPNGPDSEERKPIDQKPAQEHRVVDKELTSMKEQLSSLQMKTTQYPTLLQQANDFLDNQEFDATLQEIIMQRLLRSYYQSDSTWEEKDVVNMLKKVLSDQLKHVQSHSPYFNQKFVHIVGPTGVGKTTTIAKMAAEQALNYGKRVAFVTTDTYRIAAVDQLKTYAKILKLPLEVAYSLEEYQQARQKFKDYDLVFVDTAGRNYTTDTYVNELHKLIQVDEHSEAYLVLALTSKPKDMKRIYQQFSSIPFRQLIFTKSDETAQYGSIFNMVAAHSIGVAYVTNGQDVPDDLVEGAPEYIVGLVMGEWTYA